MGIIYNKIQEFNPNDYYEIQITSSTNFTKEDQVVMRFEKDSNNNYKKVYYRITKLSKSPNYRKNDDNNLVELSPVLEGNGTQHSFDKTLMIIKEYFLLVPKKELELDKYNSEWKNISEEGAENLLFRDSVIKQIPYATPSISDSKLRYYTIIDDVYEFAPPSEPRDINGLKVKDDFGNEIRFDIEELKNKGIFQIQIKDGKMKERTPEYIQSLKEIRITRDNIKNLREGDHIKEKLSLGRENIYILHENEKNMTYVELTLDNHIVTVSNNILVMNKYFLFQPVEEELKKLLEKEERVIQAQKNREELKTKFMNMFKDPNQINNETKLNINDVIEYRPPYKSNKKYKIINITSGEGYWDPNIRYTIETIENNNESNDVKVINDEEITNGNYYRVVEQPQRSWFSSKNSSSIAPVNEGIETGFYSVVPTGGSGASIDDSRKAEPTLMERMTKKTSKVTPLGGGRKKSRKHKQRRTQNKKQNRRTTKGKRQK